MSNLSQAKKILEFLASHPNQKFSILFIFVCLLSACSGERTLTADIQPHPTQTPSATATPPPTATPLPTEEPILARPQLLYFHADR